MIPPIKFCSPDNMGRSSHASEFQGTNKSLLCHITFYYISFFRSYYFLLLSCYAHSKGFSSIFCSHLVFHSFVGFLSQVYELSQGRCISSLLFESKLSAIALDIFELFLFGAEEKDNIIRKVKFYRTVSLYPWTACCLILQYS